MATDNLICSIAPLAHCRKLEILILARNKISSLGEKGSLSATLKHMDMSYNSTLSNIGGLVSVLSLLIGVGVVICVYASEKDSLISLDNSVCV